MESMSAVVMLALERTSWIGFVTTERRLDESYSNWRRLISELKSVPSNSPSEKNDIYLFADSISFALLHSFRSLTIP